MPPVAAHTTGSSDAAAALRGATLAFNKKKPAPPPPPKDNGALTAAASAGRPRSPTKWLGTQSTGGSTIDNEQYSQSQNQNQNGGSIAARLRQLGSSPGQLHPNVAAGRTDPKSASFIAATLAASRSASPSPKARTPRRRTSIGGSSSSGEIVDSGSIPPTGSLISMFEQSRTGDPTKRSTPKRTPVKAPKEQVDIISEERISYQQDLPSLELKPKPKPKPKPRPLTPGPQTPSKPPPELLSPKPTRPPKPVLRPKTPPQIITRHATHYLSTPSPDPQKRSPKPAVQEKQRPPTPPQPRGASKPKVESKSVLQDRPLTITQKRVAPQLEPRLSRRRPSPPTPTEARPTSALTMSSDDTFVSASSVQSPVRESPPPLLRRHFTGSNPPSPTRDFRHGHIKSSSVSSLPLESLTSAIVAGSLASARLTPHNTGGSLAPPLPRRQKSPRLMQTLRQPPKPTEEDADRHKKKGLKLHKGKHAHHEGSRKKWREEVTPRERKRYEAVWASNRGLLLDMPNAPHEAMNGDSSEYVLNTVVREIWKRSRLPADELAEVWDLVDRKGQGVLGRAEFVVGMWLIDQRLRGRKIPAKVSASVWGSANGLKVDNKRHGHKH